MNLILGITVGSMFIATLGFIYLVIPKQLLDMAIKFFEGDL